VNPATGVETGSWILLGYATRKVSRQRQTPFSGITDSGIQLNAFDITGQQLLGQ
jgi:hypothetical protein